MSRKTLIWIAFGLLLGMFAVIQFIPDANGGETLNTATANIPD